MLGGLAAAVPRVVLVVAVLLLSAGPIGCAAAARGEGQLRGGVGQLQQVRLLLLLLLLPVSPVGVVVARVVGLVKGPPAPAAAGGAPEAAAAAAAVVPSASVRGVAAPGVGLSLRPSARGFAAGPPVHGGEVLRFPKGSPPKEFQHFCGASASVARSQGAPFPPLPFSLFSRPRSLGWPVPPSSSSQVGWNRRGKVSLVPPSSPHQGGRERPTQSPLPREWAGKSGGAYADGALGGRSRAQPLFSQIGFGVNAGSIFFSG